MNAMYGFEYDIKHVVTLCSWDMTANEWIGINAFISCLHLTCEASVLLLGGNGREENIRREFSLMRKLWGIHHNGVKIRCPAYPSACCDKWTTLTTRAALVTGFAAMLLSIDSMHPRIAWLQSYGVTIVWFSKMKSLYPGHWFSSALMNNSVANYALEMEKTRRRED